MCRKLQFLRCEHQASFLAEFPDGRLHSTLSGLDLAAGQDDISLAEPAALAPEQHVQATGAFLQQGNEGYLLGTGHPAARH
ncbi:hypothetical protein GCM10017709_01180 [Glutamicibacter nicotianae]